MTENQQSFLEIINSIGQEDTVRLIDGSDPETKENMAPLAAAIKEERIEEYVASLPDHEMSLLSIALGMLFFTGGRPCHLVQN